jgi:hypothetical protein
MPFSSSPYTPVAGQSETVNNPAQAQGGGKTTSAAAVIANNSPYVLSVESQEGSGTATIYPFTRDLVELDAQAGQQLVITAIDIGVVAPSTVESIVYVTWFQANEPTPTNLPISLGNTSTTTSSQQVLLGAISDPAFGLHVQFDTNPLWRSIWVAAIQVSPTTPLSPPILTGGSGLLYDPITPPYLLPGFPAYQGFWRFIIVSALEDIEGEVDLLLPAQASQVWWGADLADVDATVYTPSGGDIGMANTPNPLRFTYAGTLDASVPIPGGAVSCPNGSTTFLTRLWAWILAGTSVDVTVRVNSAPAYSGPVDVPDLTNITVTSTPGGFVLPTSLQVFDLDIVDIVVSSLSGAPAGLGALVDVAVVP